MLAAALGACTKQGSDAPPAGDAAAQPDASAPPASRASFVATFVPAPALTQEACEEQYAAADWVPGVICSALPQDATWYSATIENHGTEFAAVRCHLTGYDVDGRILTDGDAWLSVTLLAIYVAPGQTVHFDWFLQLKGHLDPPPALPITRYDAACVPDPNPPT